MAALTDHPVTLVHPPDAAGRALQGMLRGLGFAVEQLWPVPEAVAGDGRILLVAVAKADLVAPIRLLNAYRGVRLAIVESENPRVLDAVTACEVHGVLHKPVPRAGLLAQLAVATATHGYVARLHDRLAHVEANLRARRAIERATQMLVSDRGVSEQEAYAFLRREAMRCRLPIGAMAAAIVTGEAPRERPD